MKKQSKKSGRKTTAKKRTQTNSDRLKKIILCALFTALISVSAFIRIPIGPVPITFQLFIVLLAGMLLGSKWGFVSSALYIAIGLLGLPVFTSGGGLGCFFNPTFGYVIGFPVAAFFAGLITARAEKPNYLLLLAAAFVGTVIDYSLGSLHYFLISNFYLNNVIDFKNIALCCVVPFFPKDILLCALGALLGKKLIPITNRIS